MTKAAPPSAVDGPTAGTVPVGATIQLFGLHFVLSDREPVGAGAYTVVLHLDSLDGGAPRRMYTCIGYPVRVAP